VFHNSNDEFYQLADSGVVCGDMTVMMRTLSSHLVCGECASSFSMQPFFS